MATLCSGEDAPPAVRYEKAEKLLRLALDLQGTAGGLTLADIQKRFEVSRRTAERMRDAVERLLPQLEEVNAGEIPKRWRLPAGTAGRLASVTADELAELRAAAVLFRRENLNRQAAVLDGLSAKVQALLPRDAATRVEPALEALMEAEGFALRPGPRPRVREEVLEALRKALLACRKVRLHYRFRDTGELSRQMVCPYGFLYGSRHHLVAYSMRARDYRLYILPNIERAELTEWPFERDPEFSLAAYAARSFGVFQEEPFEVVWRFSPEVAADAREYLFHPTQTMEEQPDGSLLVRFHAGGVLEMCWHLFKWGEAVEVLAPKRLRNAYRTMIESVRRSVTRTLGPRKSEYGQEKGKGDAQ